MTIVLLAAACTGSGGAVVFAPTPPPMDRLPLTYTHPSGAFRVDIPRAWGRYEQHTTTLASASFSPPNSPIPLIWFAVINLGEPVADESAFAALMDRYQTQVRPDAADYTEQSRQAMGDGSWRFTGRRIIAGETGETVNTFIQRNGAFIGIAEIVIEPDANLAELQAMVNSFVIQPTDVLQPTEVTTLTSAKPAALNILHVSLWTSPTGAFFITGEVAVYGGGVAVDLPVEASLLAVDGTALTGAVDVVMGSGIPPGGFAPFSLRFGARPENAVNFRLSVGGADWSLSAENTLIGMEGLDWTDGSRFDEFGRLVISGIVTNITGEPIQAPRAVATIFNTEGLVIGAGWAEVGISTLEAGDSAQFEIIIPETGGDPANYIVNVQGRRG